MKSKWVYGAIVAVSAAPAVDAGTFELGTFRNLDGGQIQYIGDWAPYVSSSLPGATNHTLIAIELGDVLAELGAVGFTGVTITDGGGNVYSSPNPGADIDLLTFEGLSPGAAVVYGYSGPNGTHLSEPIETLAERLQSIDAFTGATDEGNDRHVSLGQGGRLDAMFEQSVRLEELPHGNSPRLLISEAFPQEREVFAVQVHALVPTPGTLALLGAAALFSRPWRRRR